ncbi:hypothetical protein SELMODRAFT_412592 [Selaginella moellendorffii]|uniref:Bidirectional sugar transporter SWEET n=1 Tax=Selaginella moellendorffii TaxID=88036 RepID=D8RLZ7_SELML|nr:hypothetical protein SELMODRAFT_412592 [Selaginella moellendorffii]
MTLAGAIRTVMGIIGNVIAFGLFLSPAPTFRSIVKNHTTGDFSGAPYVATLFNCLLWVLYGLPFVTSNSVLVITINTIGCVIESVYLGIFLFYASKRIEKARVAGMISIVLTVYLGIVLAVFMASKDHHTRRKFAGICCAVVTIAMYASPLSIMRTVISTKSVQYMPLLPLVAGLFNGATWTAYGFLGQPHDYYIVVPNLVGACLAVIQLILYGFYSRTGKPRPIVKDLWPRIEHHAGCCNQQAAV